MKTALVLFALAVVGWYLLRRLSVFGSSPLPADADYDGATISAYDDEPGYSACETLNEARLSPARADRAAASLLDVVDYIAACYGVPLPWAAHKRQAHQHDLALMIRSGDLESAAFALLARDGRVLFRYCVQWPDDHLQVPRLSWPELPLLPVHTIARSQFRVLRRGNAASYADRLELNWSSTDPSPRRPGCEFSSTAGALSRPDAAAQLFVTNDARRTLTIINVLPNGEVAFGRHPDLPTDVYLHRDQFDRSPAVLQVGRCVTCFIVQTPRGLQGRCIRLSHKQPPVVCALRPHGIPTPHLARPALRSSTRPGSRMARPESPEPPAGNFPV